MKTLNRNLEERIMNLLHMAIQMLAQGDIANNFLMKCGTNSISNREST